MKKLFLLLLAFCIANFAFAQNEPLVTQNEPIVAQNESLASPNAATVGADSANFALREVSIDLFEREGAWTVKMSPDYGVITGRFFEGSPDPAVKEPALSGTEELLSDTRTYGAKVEFFRRGVNSFYITPSQPLAIDGVVKTISVWATGRNMPHKLTVLVQDYMGNQFELYMGTLDFTGWKQMVVSVPPSLDGVYGIVQDAAYYGTRPGLSILGFRVDCDPEFTSGSFYLYLDDLRAVTDLYAFENSDPFDMDDSW